MPVRYRPPLLRNPHLHFLQGFRLQCLEPHERRMCRIERYKPPLPQKILVVKPELFEAGSGNLRQLEFGLFGSRGSLRAFRYILLPASRSR